MTDDLVERLRDEYQKTVPLCEEAATRIEQLQAELAAARERVEHQTEGRVDALRQLGKALGERDAERERADENLRAFNRLQRKNAKLREALEFYAWAEHWQRDDYKLSVIEEDKGRRARAILKETGDGE